VFGGNAEPPARALPGRRLTYRSDLVTPANDQLALITMARLTV
jgi:hypothetical protein